METSRFQILSLDGGGIRGVYTAAYLASIEEDLGVRIVDHFDLIVGTSTGGIIALALGLGLSPSDILKFYTQHGPRIFRNQMGFRGLQHWFRRKYSGRQLRSALQDTFGDRTLGDSAKRLVITSYNIGDNDVYLFRTPHLKTLRRDYRVPAWKVALATSAAPTFFPACTEIDGIRLVDGGVWANNPSLVGLVEAIGPLGVTAEAVRLLSVGTVSGLKSFPTRLDQGGAIAWASSAPDLMLDAASVAVTNQVRFLLGVERFARVNVVAPADSVSLDDIGTVQQLIAKARHYSRKDAPHLADTFLDYKARAYEPCHRLA